MSPRDRLFCERGHVVDGGDVWDLDKVVAVASVDGQGKAAVGAASTEEKEDAAKAGPSAEAKEEVAKEGASEKKEEVEKEAAGADAKEKLPGEDWNHCALPESRGVPTSERKPLPQGEVQTPTFPSIIAPQVRHLRC